MRDAPSFAPSALRLALPPVEQRQQERDVRCADPEEHGRIPKLRSDPYGLPASPNYCRTPEATARAANE
ncbi:hypothetical protein A5CBH24_17400 [Alistipes communis]|uniref:Uncharacterized protein n=1 Tax=Alistipes communis TaxID=2585118 RepID=A0A4Y1XPD6_9BACT|nr:hypothetical protein A5CBH24_17400 [Alistipes communis]BBL13936.1 hypothetical protein A6CPBBH3_05750 [Alistipes communis]